MIFRSIAACFLLFLTAAHAEEAAPAVLAEVNFARSKPEVYARILETYSDRYASSDQAKSLREAVAFLRRAQPLPPLAWSDGIGRAARSHAQDLGPRGGNGHYGAGHSTPWRRMARQGQWSGYAGENIDYGHSDPRSIVVSLIVDHGVPGRGHRANLFSRNFRVAGVAVAPHASRGTMCVMDFATSFLEPWEPRVASRSASGLRSDYMGKSFF